jgi:hypothetical protein
MILSRCDLESIIIKKAADSLSLLLSLKLEVRRQINKMILWRCDLESII